MEVAFDSALATCFARPSRGERWSVLSNSLLI